MPIEEITVGSYVWSEDPATNSKALKKVNKIFVREKDSIVRLSINGEIIETTDEHPFYVEGKGFVGAKHLTAGDELRLQSGETAGVDKVETIRLSEPVKVYNFEVEDNHTYYVSEQRVLVHNMCAETVLSRNGAFNAAKRDAGIAKTQQPIDVKHVELREPDYMGGHVIKDTQGNIVMTREYYFKNGAGEEIVIQEHSFGHSSYGVGAHFNVRYAKDKRHKTVLGTKKHYFFIK